MSTDFGKFAEQMVYYLCSRCVLHVKHHTAQPKAGGRHSHNGEILAHLGNRLPTAAGIIAAYRHWQSCRPPTNIQAALAAALVQRQLPDNLTAVESAVLRIMQYQGDTWIRHGAEFPTEIHYDPESVWPNPNSRHQIGTAVLEHPQHNWFAVDLDSHPFQAFEEHPVENLMGPPWVYTVGLLPYTVFVKRRGQLQHPNDRDHYYAQTVAPASEWLFLYRDLDEHAQDAKQQQQAQQRLIHSGLATMHYADYQWFTQMLRHLTNLARVQNSRLR